MNNVGGSKLSREDKKLYIKVIGLCPMKNWATLLLYVVLCELYVGWKIDNQETEANVTH